jgi:hypothetical protein
MDLNEKDWLITYEPNYRPSNVCNFIHRHEDHRRMNKNFLTMAIIASMSSSLLMPPVGYPSQYRASGKPKPDMRGEPNSFKKRNKARRRNNAK